MLVCFDLETTGLNPKNDKIIEVALVKFDEKTFEIHDTFSTLVDPEIAIPELISNITNIFDEDVIGAPKIDDIREKIINFIGGLGVVGHNVEFDIDFLLENAIYVGEHTKIDTFLLANFLNYNNDSLNLEVLCTHYNIEFSGAHRALNDVYATINLLQAQLEDFSSYGERKKQILSYIFASSKDKNMQFLLELFKINDTKNIYFDTLKKNIFHYMEKYENSVTKQDRNVDNEDIISFFEEKLGIEKRENQLKMAEKVKENFDKKGKIVLEAPTGLGKSFAYLIPALIFSVKNNKKVYVSTKTKTLQDQLYSKDLLFLKEKSGIDFSYTKLKGKQNYISIQGFFNILEIGEFEYFEVFLYAKLALWLCESKHGELDELTFYPREYSMIRYMRGDSLGLMGEKNPYLLYEFVYKARKNIEKSDIIIINHSLLFSDFENENPILTDLSHVIIDEAHSLEDTLTESVKKRYSKKSLQEVFDTCNRICTSKKIKKIDFSNKVESIQSKLAIFDELGYEYINKKEPQEQPFKTILLQKEFYVGLDISEIVKKINLDFLDIRDFLRTQDLYNFSKEIELLDFYKNTINNIFVSDNDDKIIKIISWSNKAGLFFDYTLLSPASYLEKNVWSQLETCVLTSATLSIDASFDYIKNTLGLASFDFFTFETDFDYEKQSSLFIINDLGSIKTNSRNVVAFLDDFYETVHGNTLTLLTSFSMIKSIYTHSNIHLKNLGIQLLAQSLGGSKSKLISQFLQTPHNSILLGTSSFWEGVDISGGDLKYLVIHKFPFQVPNDPIFQARSVFFKNSFLEYSLPKAVIMLQQGFGRLIRSKNDSGIVILLDDRIINTDWGKSFYAAFPKDINKKICTSQSLISLLKDI